MEPSKQAGEMRAKLENLKQGPADAEQLMTNLTEGVDDTIALVQALNIVGERKKSSEEEDDNKEEEEEEEDEEEGEEEEEKEVEEGDEEEELEGFPYVFAIIGGQSIKLYPRSLMPARLDNSCDFCRAPFVLGQTRIVKVQKISADNTTDLWICHLHVHEMIFADDRHNQQQQQQVGQHAEEEEHYRVWRHTLRIARCPGACWVPHCTTSFEVGKSRIVGARKYNPSTGTSTRKLDALGQETGEIYWLCANHMNENSI
jgi:hypothetical protein